VPLRLINLDDLTWEKLNAEARSLIPSNSGEWTNFNPSDPGITLLELFAYISEGLMYELNRISSKNVLAFLRLIHGPGWQPGRSLAEEKRSTVLELRRPQRAITAQDYEHLALATNEVREPSHLESVARAKCIFQRNLQNPGRAAQVDDAPGHVSIVIVPNRRSRASTALLRSVRRALEPARLLTTRIHVVRPRFVTVSVRLTIVPKLEADPVSLQDDALEQIQKFFDPLEGGFDGRGWPFGKHVYVSEIYQLLDRLPGVNYITRSRHPDSGAEIDELVVAPGDENRLRWNKSQELEAINLRSDELVSVWVDANDITIVAR
jgi:hypothetical protein